MGVGAANGFQLEYSLNNGASWNTLLDHELINISNTGTAQVSLPSSQNISLVQVRDRLSAVAPVAGEPANVIASVSGIRLEVETDTTAPVISNVAAGGITTSGATITWNTNENSDSQVVYGTTQAYGQSTTLNPALVTAHSQVLSGLAANTLYHYRVKSKDAAGNLVVSGDFTFTTAQNGSAGIKWLVTDHLGSTRMVIDETGSLAGIKRHDFCPFGEELGAGIGIRSAALGYGTDTIRQKFTGKERDNETSLDYFLARYYSSTQGRFTSPDVPFADQSEEDPQSWNLYVYVGNNPLTYTDPFGMWKKVSCGDGNCWEAEEGDTLKTLAEQSGVSSAAINLEFGYLLRDNIKAGATVVDVTGVQQHLEEVIARMPLFEPAIGGGIIKRYGQAAARSLISKAWSGLKNYFGRGSAGAAKNIGGITAEQAAKLRELLESIPGVQKVGAFGSRTKGTHTANSDLDIALFGEVNRFNPNTLRIIGEVQKYAESIGIGTGKGHSPLDINVWKSIRKMKQTFRNSPNFDPSKGVPTAVPTK